MLISLRPSPSAAASVPLCISRYSFPWSIGQDNVPCAPQKDVIQTCLLWRVGAEREASACTWVCVRRQAACSPCNKGELGMLLLPTRAALFSGLFREHLFISQVLAAFPSISSGRVLKKKPNPTGLFSVSFLSQLRNFVPFELFQISSSIHEWGHWSPSVILLDSLYIHSYPFFYYLLSWHGKGANIEVPPSSSFPGRGLVFVQMEHEVFFCSFLLTSSFPATSCPVSKLIC